jgi:hypothetical protein
MLTNPLRLLRSCPPQDLTIRSQRRNWGEHWVDAPISELWCRREWSDVCADELIFLLPSLRRDSYVDTPDFGLATYIREAMIARLAQAITTLTRNANGAIANAAAVLEIIEASGATTSLSDEEKACALRHCVSYLSGRGRSFRTVASDQNKALWHFELSVLATLDRMLIEAGPRSPSCGTRRSLLDTLDLPDALLASIHSRLNAAYVLPQFVFAHELFMVGAWLGLLCAGRDARLPVGIAAVFADIFGESLPLDGSGANDILVELLIFHAQTAIDASTLLKISRCVVAGGSSVLVRAGVHQDNRSRAHPIWNSKLHEHIDLYLQKNRSLIATMLDLPNRTEKSHQLHQ